MNSKNQFMKKRYLMIVSFLLILGSCAQQDFDESYFNPEKVADAPVDKQFAGFVITNRDYVIPSYWNYFVVMRPTVNRWTQVVGWANAPAQYVPGGGLVSDRWANFYHFTGQYKDLLKIYNALTPAEQADQRIYYIIASIYFYDHTQKVVDVHGDIPWSQAGLLSTYDGDYVKASPAYDAAEDIYTKMLDDLKAFADELNTIVIKVPVQNSLNNQDLINSGNIDLWKRYCNSLRLRMLMRVSDVPAFQSRVTSEIDAMLANPATYPLIVDNVQNARIDIFRADNSNPEINLNSTGFQGGLEDWNGNIAGKAMIDNMKANSDPRLRVMFEPGAAAGGVYNGLDPMLAGSTQEQLIAGGTISIYHRSTFSRNDFFPGVLINAAEVHFLLAEYYLRDGNDALAKSEYNAGIDQSIRDYYRYYSLTADFLGGTVAALDPQEITDYQSETDINWDNAVSADEKLEMIATQKWLHYSIVQPMEGWAELRRMDVLDFDFEVDNSNAQTLPPGRWLYPASEITYNSQNYSAVKAKDNLTTKIFWDVQ
jgi:hypothetical protein